MDTEMRVKRRHEVVGQSAATSYRRIKSDEIFAGAAEVVIEHEETEYLLKITSQGKLLLMK